MYTFDYHRPKNKREVCELLAEYKDTAKLIAGGTDLLVQMFEQSDRLINIKNVIDLTHIKDLNYIVEGKNIIRIGAMTTHTEIVESDILKKFVSFLSESSFLIGSPKIRNTGTVGGNISNASPAADSVVPLIALNAKVKILGLSGEREELLSDFIKNPYDVDLKEDEFLTEIYFDKPKKNDYNAFVKLGRRKAMAISRMTVAVTIRLSESGLFESVTIVPGCIFPVPKRLFSVEKLMIGEKVSDKLLERVSKEAAKFMIETTGRRWSTPYKEPVLQSLTNRAIRKALHMEVHDE